MSDFSKNVISKEEAEKIVKECYSIADFCRKVGWQPRGDNYKIFHKYVKQYNLDISHFTGQRSNIGNPRNVGLSVKDFFVKNKMIKSEDIKRKLIKENLKEYKCEKCGLSEWLGNKISLQLHHIDGDNTNNLLENLQLLCPNCHSQTDSYCGKKNTHNYRKHFLKPLNTCSKCGKTLDRKTKSGLCINCYNEKRAIVNNCPSKEELLEIKQKLKSRVQIGKHYNVSDNTIKKWFKARNII